MGLETYKKPWFPVAGVSAAIGGAGFATYGVVVTGDTPPPTLVQWGFLLLGSAGIILAVVFAWLGWRQQERVFRLDRGLRPRSEISPSKRFFLAEKLMRLAKTVEETVEQSVTHREAKRRLERMPYGPRNAAGQLSMFARAGVEGLHGERVYERMNEARTRDGLAEIPEILREEARAVCPRLWRRSLESVGRGCGPLEDV